MSEVLYNVREAHRQSKPKKEIPTMLKIHANSLSQPCNKVRYACELLGLEYEWIAKDFQSGELKSPEYLALHPAGKVPVIEDDGMVLFESEAIVRYLCDKHGSALYPRDLVARAIVDQWSAFSVQHVGLAMGKVVFNRLIAPMFELEVDERSLAEGIEWLKRYLPIVDSRLSASPYLGGDNLTIADLSLLSVLDAAERADVALADYAALSKWRAGLQSQDFWKKAQSGE